jgi:hypothetical protein
MHAIERVMKSLPGELPLKIADCTVEGFRTRLRQIVT